MTPQWFASVLGPSFKATDLPKTFALLEQAGADAKRIANDAKRLWQRPRPFAHDPRVTPCVGQPDTASYPSGHAILAQTWAGLLIELYPDRKDQLLARAQQVADDRVLAGLHYPSDIAAGATLGRTLVEKLLASPALQADLAAAKTELRPTVPK
jgi:acid phosphatase (class A)